MKNLLTAIILGIVFAGGLLAQTSTDVKVAVVEFTPGPNASEIAVESKRHIQTFLAAALEKSGKFDIADIRWTQNESKNNLADINSNSATVAAAKLGKKLGVSYVLTGTVVEFTPKGADGFAYIVLKIRLIDVSTGKVKYTTEVSQKSISAMRSTHVAEIQAKVVKPVIENLKEKIVGLKF